MLDDTDNEYLGRAIGLAEMGRGSTSPNPIVGAVIVRDGGILGEGWHKGAGLDHAEIAAIRDALDRADVPASSGTPPVDWDAVRSVCTGATMYVTLEPCCTQGRTPPCTAALISGGFSRVVAGAIDPSPSVNGKGLEALTKAGIACEVAEGVLAHQAMRQNDGMRKSLARGLPFVTYKYAMTLDGRVASDSGDSRWISSSESRALVHRWRSASDAVVVGAGTVRTDDPTLTARQVDCSCQPLRVVVDAECALLRGSRLVRTAKEGPVLVICGEDVAAARRAEVESWGVTTTTVARSPKGGLPPRDVCAVLASRGVQSVLLEGGPRLAASWWSEAMIDKVAAFVSPRMLAGNDAFGALVGEGAASVDQAVELQEISVEMVGRDVLVTGYREGPF